LKGARKGLGLRTPGRAHRADSGHPGLTEERPPPAPFGAFLSYVATYRSPAGEEQRLLFAESLEQAHSLASEQAPPGWMLVEVRPNIDLD